MKAQQQNASSSGGGFWHRLGQHLGNIFSGHSWNYMMRESVTTRILPAEPNGYVTAATNAAGLIAPAAGKAGKVLGPVGSIINFANDPSPKSAVMNGLPFLVPETGVPLAIYGAAEDGSGFVANHVIIPVFTPDASQARTIDDGNGHSIPNPAMMDGSELIP
ncbi:hypothetical protein ACOBR2_05415 [Telmatobacter bradus]|uniref:hypothetical protein n=1 Tax=Telmatobacter bradus TaxID=474953 RepID=UPI003B42FE55